MGSAGRSSHICACVSQGTGACPTCGHQEEPRGAFKAMQVGSIVYAWDIAALFSRAMLVQHRGPTTSSLHFEAFDKGTCEESAFKAAFAFAKIMRERIFVADLSLVESHEEFDTNDQSSRHIYGLSAYPARVCGSSRRHVPRAPLTFRVASCAVGDAPVAYMRWRVLQQDGTQCVIMERVLVLKTHRQRGIGRQLVAFALQVRTTSGCGTCTWAPPHLRMYDALPNRTSSKKSSSCASPSPP